jgi:hypothetical protein
MGVPMEFPTWTPPQLFRIFLLEAGAVKPDWLPNFSRSHVLSHLLDSIKVERKSLVLGLHPDLAAKPVLIQVVWWNIRSSL